MPVCYLCDLFFINPKNIFMVTDGHEGRTLHTSVIHALFVRLTADARYTHIAYGQRMK